MVNRKRLELFHSRVTTILAAHLKSDIDELSARIEQLLESNKPDRESRAAMLQEKIDKLTNQRNYMLLSTGLDANKNNEGRTQTENPNERGFIRFLKAVNRYEASCFDGDETN